MSGDESTKHELVMFGQRKPTSETGVYLFKRSSLPGSTASGPKWIILTALAANAIAHNLGP